MQERESHEHNGLFVHFAALNYKLFHYCFKVAQPSFRILGITVGTQDQRTLPVDCQKPLFTYSLLIPVLSPPATICAPRPLCAPPAFKM